MKSCFGYVRVSTTKQGDGVSLEAQRDAITLYADRNNISIINWFEEKETAAKSGRPIFNAMIRLLRNNKADGVVLHKPDRAARNFADWAKMGELADAGIDVHFASEALDFRSRGGRLSADIQAVIAADYIRNLKDEIHKGINGRLKQGLYPFKAPIGYCDNGSGKVKTIDPIRGPMVKRVFELYASGEYSLRTLLIEIRAMGLQTDSGTFVSKGSLECMLGNPFYTGIIRIKRSGAVYSGSQEPLISPSLYEQVQSVRAGKSGKKVTKHSHTYRGLFRCQRCEKSMVPELQKGHVYYRCHTPACPPNTIREEYLEKSILDIFQRCQMTDDAVHQLMANITEWIKERQCQSKPSTYPMQLNQIDIRLERLTDALIDRLIDNDEFNKRKNSLMLERSVVQEKADIEAKTDADPNHIQKFLELVKNLYSSFIIATKAEKRQIVEFSISNRTVFEKKIFVEPYSWLLDTQTALSVLVCPPDASTSRSSPEMLDQYMEQLVSLSREARELPNMANRMERE